MNLSQTYLRLRDEAWTAAAERTSAARALEEAAEGLAEVLDRPVAALTPDTWESAVAVERADELGVLASGIRLASDEIAAAVAALRADAARHEDAAAWLSVQYWHAWRAELETTISGEG